LYFGVSRGSVISANCSALIWQVVEDLLGFTPAQVEGALATKEDSSGVRDQISAMQSYLCNYEVAFYLQMHQDVAIYIL
jgi:hypothetical protein